MRIFESEAEANTTYTPLIPGEGEKFVPLIWMFTFKEYPLVLLRSTPLLHNLSYWTCYTLTRFWAHPQNHEKRLLALSCLSIYTSIHTELNYHWTELHEICIPGFFLKTLSRKFKFQQALYVKIFVHLWHLAKLSLEWEMFQTQVVEKIKKHILSSVTYFPIIVPFMR
jgi:hypothetical protein